MFCQLAFLRKCISTKDIKRTLNKLPKTLEGTYTRILEEIDEQNWKYAHIIFQCVAAAFRPLRVDELSQFLAFDFDTESTPTFLADELSGDPADTVLSMCSSLLAVVKPEGQEFPVVQFAHFTVKEYLTSKPLEAMGTISRFHFSMTSAHTILAQGCLGLLLPLDETDFFDNLKNFPLAGYAAKYWVAHARIEGVSLKVENGMKRMFDPSKSHFSVWVSIYDPEDNMERFRSRHFGKPHARATPLHFAAFCGVHDVVKFLIVEHSQDVNARAFDDKETPLHVASHRGHADIAQLLLEHGADGNARDYNTRTALFLSSDFGYVEVVRILLEQGADTEAQDDLHQSPLSRASSEGHVEVCRVLLEHGANVNSKGFWGGTPLHDAQKEEVARLLLNHGADANTSDIYGQTPLHYVSHMGYLGAAQVLLEHGVDANVRDDSNATPLHRACITVITFQRGPGDKTGVVRLLLRYGSDIHARDDEGRTPFMIATGERMDDIMRLLLEHGAEDHRK